MDRAHKEEKVAALHQALQGAQMVVVAHQNGMTVAESTDLRRRLRAAGAGFRITKNRLARIALKGTPFEGLDGMFTGPTAVAYAADPVAVSKAAMDFAKINDKLVILGGGLGPRTLDRAGVEALAKLPPLTELRARLLGMLQTPASRIVGVLQAPGGQLARVLKAHADKSQEPEGQEAA